MSISGALSNALSGLNVTSRRAEVVANNIANASTEGYSARNLDVSARSPGFAGGVRVDGITRHVDPALQSARRLVGASVADAGVRDSFTGRISDLMGLPGEPGSLGDRLAELDAALISAASLPDSEVRFAQVVSRATDLVSGINSVERGIQSLRVEADQAINQQVGRLNTLLADVQQINARMGSATAGENATLADMRDGLINEINEIVPVRVAPRDHGRIALYTPGGAILLDGKAAEVGFAPTPTIMPHMTLDSGDLSGLSVNGVALATSPPGGALRGGSLGALFAVRDDLTVTAQAGIDGFARDLAERFQGFGPDPTLAPTDAGLFTDLALPVTAADEVGLAGRLRLNTAVDPASGGELWRLRDGLAATTPGPVGNNALLSALSDALNTVAAPVSGSLPTAPRSLHGVMADLQAQAGQTRHESERRLGFLTAQADVLKMQALENGVDTDQEMQKLLLIEQSYAANARVIETVGKLLDALLRI